MRRSYRLAFRALPLLVTTTLGACATSEFTNPGLVRHLQGYCERFAGPVTALDIRRGKDVRAIAGEYRAALAEANGSPSRASAWRTCADNSQPVQMMAATANDFGALGTRVDGLERSVGDLNEGMGAIDHEVDRGFADFGRELRSVVATLTSQIGSDRKTNWVPIISAIGLAAGMLAAFGSQALTPVSARVDRIEAAYLSRPEFNQRLTGVDIDLHRLQARDDEVEQRHYEE